MSLRYGFQASSGTSPQRVPFRAAVTWVDWLGPTRPVLSGRSSPPSHKRTCGTRTKRLRTVHRSWRTAPDEAYIARPKIAGCVLRPASAMTPRRRDGRPPRWERCPEPSRCSGRDGGLGFRGGFDHRPSDPQGRRSVSTRRYPPSSWSRVSRSPCRRFHWPPRPPTAIVVAPPGSPTGGAGISQMWSCTEWSRRCS